ncbi:MAG: AMP-binding protein, partial [bacterium]
MSESNTNGARDTFPARFMENVKRLGKEKIFMREKKFGIWQSYSWRDANVRIRDFALGLASLGFQRGDRLGIAGDNRPELYFGMLAAQMLGGVPVPLYQDSNEREMEFIVDHADARFALVEDQEQVDKMLGIKEKCPKLEYVFYKDPRGLRNYKQDYLKSITDIEEMGIEFGKNNPGFLEAEIKKITPNDIAAICYTSGTTGAPKGVILLHRHLVIGVEKFLELEPMAPDTSTIAYLPMGWVGDFFFSFCTTIIGGFTVNCPESADTVLQDLREIGPNFFFAPPRIWENILTGVMIRMEDAGWIKRGLFRYFTGLATRIQKKRNRKENASVMEKIMFQLGRLLVFGPLLDNLGLRKVKIAYTGGETIGPEVFDFFSAMGIHLKQIYGMTET